MNLWHFAITSRDSAFCRKIVSPNFSVTAKTAYSDRNWYTVDSETSVSTRNLVYVPGEPHGYSLRNLTLADCSSVDFADVAALSNSNTYQILVKIETNQTSKYILDFAGKNKLVPN